MLGKLLPNPCPQFSCKALLIILVSLACIFLRFLRTLKSWDTKWSLNSSKCLPLCQNWLFLSNGSAIILIGQQDGGAQLPVFLPASTSVSASASSVLLWISSDQICVALIEEKQCFSTKLKYLLKVSAFTISVTGSCKQARIILATEAIWQFIVCVSAALIRARFDQIEFKFCSLLHQSMEV